MNSERTQVGTTSSTPSSLSSTPVPSSSVPQSPMPSTPMPALVPFITFDWDAYLKETNSTTAPPEYFKQVSYFYTLDDTDMSLVIPILIIEKMTYQCPFFFVVYVYDCELQNVIFSYV